jgi:hypothetical protein
MLLRILTYHQVMPIYIDFLSVFGSQAEPRDLRFSGFREQNLIKEPARGPQVEFLGRSGRQFQLCYNLKASNYISLPDTKLREQEWSIRQAAIHHQFDVETGASFWIVTKGDKEIKNRIEDMTGVDGRPEDRDFSSPENCFRRTLDAHLVCCHWSVEDWRWYIRWLEESIDRAVSNSKVSLMKFTNSNFTDRGGIRSSQSICPPPPFRAKRRPICTKPRRENKRSDHDFGSQRQCSQVVEGVLQELAERQKFPLERYMQRRYYGLF